MAPRQDLPTLSPIRPPLATSSTSRLSVRSTSSTRPASPPEHGDEHEATALEASIASLPLSPSLAVVDEQPHIDDDVFSTTTSSASGGNLEGASALLREHLKRTDSIRLGKQKLASLLPLESGLRLVLT